MMTRRISIINFLALLAVTGFFLFPIFVIVLTSLKTMQDINGGSILSLPSELTVAPWRKAWAQACVGGRCGGLSIWFWNSVEIVVPSLLLSLVFGSIAGFCLCRVGGRLARILHCFFAIAIFIPAQSILYPMVYFVSKINMFGTIIGISFVHAIFGLPLVSILFSNYFSMVSKDLWLAAQIDGATLIGAFFFIGVPMSLPVIAAVLSIQFTYIWNDYLLAIVFSGPSHIPVTAALNALAGIERGPQEYNVNMAGAIITALPPIIVYGLSGRIFTLNLPFRE